MNVAIEKRPELRAAALRHRGPYHRISEAFTRLGELAGRAGLYGPGKPTMIAIYYDDPDSTPEAELRSDAALVIPEDVRIPDGLTEVRLPAGRYAHLTHVGPYTQLGDAWARLRGQWLPQSGERFGTGEMHEIYVNTPMEAPPEKLQTELYLPLAS
jgi:AraC family transcriptional regulator